MMAQYAMTITLSGSLDAVKPRVLEALMAQGFGVLTEIDVQRTLHDKLGADMEPYLILGACNPTLAHQALTTDRAIGLLLPCNLVLRGLDGYVEVSILDPKAMFAVVGLETQQALAALPDEAKRRLQAALHTLATGNES